MVDDLYDTDILAWSGQQAALLRRVACGELVNGVDWENVIQEIDDVGGAILNAVQSYLRQAMVHLLKVWISPEDRARAHWLSEIDAFLADAEQRFSPSMRQRIDLSKIYAKVRTLTIRRYPGQSVPPTCPWTLDELLAGDTGALLAALSPTAADPA